MPITLLASLAFVALRFDALSELARAAAGLPSFGRPRTLDYRALANVEATDAQRLLRGARIPRADRRIVATDARVVSARLLRSIDMTVRRTVERGGALRPCDECHTQPAEPLPETAVQLGARPLCLGCTRALADRVYEGVVTSALAWDHDYSHEYRLGCGCDGCVAHEVEQERQADAAECEVETVRCPSCDGHGDVPSGRHSAHNPTGLVECQRCGGAGEIAVDDLHAEPLCAGVA